jgi:hypothetical protein
MAAELRGRPGAAEDRRRWGFAEGEAMRRPRERRRPRAAVAGGLAGGGCGGEASSRLWRRRFSSSSSPVGGGPVVLLPIKPFFPSSLTHVVLLQRLSKIDRGHGHP